jgi:hypothetical protein
LYERQRLRIACVYNPSGEKSKEQAKEALERGL